MSFLRSVTEQLRDKTRDEVCEHLCALELDARMAERGRPEEHITLGKGKTLGLIEIRDSPIRWVNVVKWKRGGGSPVETETRYRNIYLVPDARLSSQHLMKPEEDIEVYSFPEQECWAIVSNWYHFFPYATSSKLLRLLSSMSGMPNEPPPSRGNWNNYEAIASHLLESSRK